MDTDYLIQSCKSKIGTINDDLKRLGEKFKLCKFCDLTKYHEQFFF